jgi:hypothetical protein
MMWTCAYCEHNGDRHLEPRSLEGYSRMMAHTHDVHPDLPMRRVLVES